MSLTNIHSLLQLLALGGFTRQKRYSIVFTWLPDVRYSRLVKHYRLADTPYLSSLKRLASSAPGGARRFRPIPSSVGRSGKSNSITRTKKASLLTCFSFWQVAPKKISLKHKGERTVYT